MKQLIRQKTLQEEPSKTECKQFATGLKLEQLTEKYKEFNKTEIELIKSRFDKYAENGVLTKRTFRDMVGLLGCEEAPFLADRIFYVIDQKERQVINLEDFIAYLNIMINGSVIDKAKLSFKFIDQGKKQHINHKDIENLVKEVSNLWKHLSGSRVVPHQYYVDKIISIIDPNLSGKVQIKEYLDAYQNQGNQFDWFQYFNSEDEIQELIIKIKESENRLQEYMQFSPIKQNNSQTCVQNTFIQSINLSPLKKSPSRENGFNNCQGVNDYEIQLYQKKHSDSNINANQNIDIKNTSHNISQFLTCIEGASQYEGNENYQNNINLSIYNNQLDVSQSGPIFVNLQGEQNIGDTGLNFGAIEGECQSDFLEEEDFEQVKKKIDQQQTERDETTRKKTQDIIDFDDMYSQRYNQKQSLLTQFNTKISQIQDLIIKMEDIMNSELPHEQKAYLEQEKKKNGSSVKPGKQENSWSSHYRETYNKSNDENSDDDAQSQKRMFIRKNTIQKMPSSSKFRHSGKRKEEIKDNLQIYFGHENWNIIVNLMIGIRYSVRNLFDLDCAPKNDDFRSKNKIDLVSQNSFDNDDEGLKNAFQFIDYAPAGFEHIRKAVHLQREHYLRSVGPEKLLGNLIMGRMNSLTELVRCSQRKKGQKGESFQYFTEDGKFIAVTIEKEAFKQACQMLQSYYNYISKNSKSYLCRIFGLHKIKVKTKKELKNIRFMAVGNIFSTLLEIDVRYEIKGSTHKRTEKKNNAELKSTTPLKDLDFINDNVKLNLTIDDKQQVISQLAKDIKFLQENNLFNYRLLIGIHKTRKNFIKRSGLAFLNPNKEDLYKEEANIYDQIPSIQSKCGDYTYFIGIINYHKPFKTSNAFTHSFKGILINQNISTVPPDQYGDRLFSFIKQHVLM